MPNNNDEVISLEPFSSEKAAYAELEMLIQQRQLFETAHPEPPYSTYPTDINYRDANSLGLIHYAAMIGDLDKIKHCLAQGADINLHNDCDQPSGDPAITLALENRQVAVANYLYTQGASCEKIHLTHCADETTRQWFSEKLKAALDQTYPTPSNLKAQKASNAFFKKQIRNPKLALPLIRASEIGYLEFLKRAKIEKNLDVFNKHQWDLLLTAVKSNQLEIVKWLVEDNKISIKPKKAYTENLLQQAIKFGHRNIVNYLLEHGADINWQDDDKVTPLMAAVEAEDKELITLLLSQGARVTDTNIFGNSVLHYAASSKDCAIASELMQSPCTAALLVQKNIFGHTPVDIAIQEKNDQLFALFCPQRVATEAQQDPQYGKRLPEIDQNSVNRKMFFYLQSQYRSTELFSVDGNCKAFALLRQIYNHKKEYYFATLALMANWSGDQTTLTAEFPNDIPQAIYYKNLAELFEQWVNNVCWLQQYPHYLLDSDDLAENYAIISQPHQPYRTIHQKRLYTSFDQIEETLVHLCRVPGPIHFLFIGAEHATSANKDADGTLSYYDSNITYQIIFSEIFKLFVDHHSVNLGHSDKLDLSKGPFTVEAFSFAADSSPAEIETLSGITPSLFWQPSPNSYTPVHAAVLARDAKTLKTLLDAKTYDLEQKDQDQETALDLALVNGYEVGVKLITECTALNCLSVDPESLDIAIKKGFITAAYLVANCPRIDFSQVQESKMAAVMAYETNDISLLEKIMQGNSSQALGSLLSAATQQQDWIFIEALLKEHIASIVTLENTLVIINAIEMNPEKMLGLLCQYKAPLDQIACYAWGDKKETIVKAIINFPQKIKLPKLILMLIKQNNHVLLNDLFKQSKLNVNDGENLFETAVRFNAIDCFNFLLEIGSKPPKKLIKQICKKDNFYQAFLLKYPLPVNQPDAMDNNDNAAIHYALSNHNLCC